MSETKITMTKDQLFKVIRLSEQENKTESRSNSGFENMVSTLLHSQTQVHIFHLQTKSYSEHKALQGYYEGIDDLVMESSRVTKVSTMLLKIIIQ